MAPGITAADPALDSHGTRPGDQEWVPITGSWAEIFFRNRHELAKLHVQVDEGPALWSASLLKDRPQGQAAVEHFQELEDLLTWKSESSNVDGLPQPSMADPEAVDRYPLFREIADVEGKFATAVY